MKRPVDLPPRLSDDEFRAVVTPILARGGSWRDVAEATGQLFDTARIRARRLGLKSHAKGGLISASPPAVDRSRKMSPPDGWPGWCEATAEQRVAAVMYGLRENFGCRRMSEALGVSRQTLQKWVQRAPKLSGQSDAEITAATEARRVQAIRDAKATKRAARIKQAEPMAEKLRVLVDSGYSVAGAARQLGLTVDRGKQIARTFGIRASAEALRAVMVAGARKGGAATATATRKPKLAPQPKPQRAPEQCAPRLVRNPKLSAAQQAVADAIKAASWWHYNQQLIALPPISEDEAARLIADHIARHGVTRCPPPTPTLEPHNYGVGWGYARKSR